MISNNLKFDFAKIRAFISATVTCIAIIALTIYLMNHWSQLPRIESQSGKSFIFFAVLFLLNILTNSQIIESSTQSHDIHLTKFESFGITTLTRLVNQFIPGRLGLAVRAFYLKKKYNLGYSNFTTILASSQVVSIATACIAGLITSVILLFETSIPHYIFAVFGLTFLALVLTLYFPIALIPNKIMSIRLVKNLLNGWNTTKEDPNWLIRTAIWSLSTTLVLSLMYKCTFYMVGIKLGLAECLFIATLSTLSGVISITPAGLGITEAFIIIAGNILGIPPHLSLACALLHRILGISILLLISPYITKKLFNLPLIGILAFVKEKSS